MSWTPIFSKIVDSSLWSEPDHVVKVFLTLLAKKGSDQIVRGNAFEIGRWSNKTEEEAIGALKVLSSPDRKRIEPQPFDGRRIEKVDGGYKILNGQFYEEEMRREMERNRKAKWARESREKERLEGLSGVKPKRRPKRSLPPTGEGLLRNAEDPGELADRVNEEMEANRRELNGDQSEPFPNGVAVDPAKVERV